MSFMTWTPFRQVLRILRDMPFVVPFEARARLFQTLVAAVRERDAQEVGRHLHETGRETIWRKERPDQALFITHIDIISSCECRRVVLKSMSE